MREIREEERNFDLVTKKEGEKMANLIGAQNYFECSAITERNFKELRSYFPFVEESAKLVLHLERSTHQNEIPSLYTSRNKCLIF